MLHKSLSGIILNQQNYDSDFDQGALGDWSYQEFVLPPDYMRGTDAGEQRYPALTGFQLYAPNMVNGDWELEFVLERQVFGLGWLSEATGSLLSASDAEDDVWLDFYLTTPVTVSDDAADDRWRIGFRDVNQPDTGHNLTIGMSDNITFLYRILGYSADEGVDFLGNNYRSVVIEQDVDNVTTGEGSDDDTFWFSKPNPSKFAVESLYFDLTPESAETHAIINSVLVDPITPGVYFHIYYSDEGDPASDADEWDQKLWVRVPQTFRALKRETHVLPEPISTKYVKIEFSHLQAQHYQSGNFSQLVTYKKHPKWVLDYFLLRHAVDDRTVADRVGIVWDTLDLAYNYYLDDIRQEPDAPVDLNRDDVGALTSFLRSRDDVSDQISPEMLDRINLALKPYTDNLATRPTYDHLLGDVIASQSQVNLQTQDYPTETAVTFTSNRSSDVGALRSERIVFEQSYPVMFFYLTSRHAYREVQANFSHDRAYFVGIRQIAFNREHYTAAHDTSLYIEATNDSVNLETNDFESEGNQWVVYTE